VVYEEYVFALLLDRSGDALSVLRAEDECAENEQVEGALEKLDAWVLGRHPT
jgi:hypothetical protein